MRFAFDADFVISGSFIDTLKNECLVIHAVRQMVKPCTVASHYDLDRKMPLGIVFKTTEAAR